MRGAAFVCSAGLSAPSGFGAGLPCAVLPAGGTWELLELPSTVGLQGPPSLLLAPQCLGRFPGPG
eukprot:14071026-Heterocapsa_arctica.AAC.1